MDEPFIAESALKRGFSRADILHAYIHEGYSEEVDEDMVMYVGPDLAANLLEVGIAEARLPEYDEAIVHVMRARAYYVSCYYETKR